jgi:hypothetical protein
VATVLARTDGITLGFTHFGTRNRNGKYKVGRKTEKSRLRRSMASLTELMRDIQSKNEFTGA